MNVLYKCDGSQLYIHAEYVATGQLILQAVYPWPQADFTSVLSVGHTTGEPYDIKMTTWSWGFIATSVYANSRLTY